MSDIDDKLKSEALNWLVSLRGAAEKAGGFILEQAPDALRELVAVGRFERTSYLVIGLVIVIAGVAMFRKSTNLDLRWIGDVDFRGLVRFLAPVGCIGVIIGGFGLVAENYHDCATSWFGPRIYILETLANMASKAVGK